MTRVFLSCSLSLSNDRETDLRASSSMINFYCHISLPYISQVRQVSSYEVKRDRRKLAKGRYKVQVAYFL